MYQYKPLTDISYKDIHKAFENAFSDYVVPFQLTLEELSYMIGRRGYCDDISFGAFWEDDLVGFTLNGVGKWNGKLTAYDTGTGVLGEHRKKGLAQNIFLESIPVLRNNKIENYLLEVIDTNKPAIDLYKKMGFRETRRFDFQRVKISDLKLKTCDDSIKIIKTETANWNKLRKLWNNNPSWQNSVDSINRKRDSFEICLAQIKEQVIGYGVIQKSNGDIPQLAVDKKYRRQNIASSLISSLTDYTDSDTLRFINTIQTDTETRHCLDALGIKKKADSSKC